MLSSIFAISAGASLGALLRWLLASKLNPLFPVLPAGTLTANVLGGYLVGIGMAYFGNHPQLSAQWRLFIMTGFLGGLTTFSTFSAEVTLLLQNGRPLWAAGAVISHVGLSLLMTSLGILSVAAYRHF